MSRADPLERDPAGRAAAAGSLPCLNRNNSTEPLEILSTVQRKTAWALTQNIGLLAERHGLSRLGFLTLTFRDHVTDIREAQRRFNSLRSHVLVKRYPVSIAVVERQKSGRLHFHLLVALEHDIRTGFDFDQVGRGVYTSANSWLRHEWGFWRKTALDYGFGRTELLPVKSTAEGIAKYVGKYIAKHLDQREDRDKGARLVRYSKGAKCVNSNFAWNSSGAKLWRLKLEKWATTRGLNSMAEIALHLGPKWAYLMRDSILATLLDHYPTARLAAADGVDVPEGADMDSPLTISRGGDDFADVRSLALEDLADYHSDQGAGAKGAPGSGARPSGVPRWRAHEPGDPF